MDVCQQAIYNELVVLGQQNSDIQVLVDRHIMKHTSNKQLALVIAACGGKSAATSERFKAFMQQRVSNISCIQIVEDMNGAQSKSSAAPCRKYRRPATAAAYILESDIVSTRHSYEDICIQPTAPRKKQAMDPDMFEARRSPQTLPFHEVVSTTQQAAWYTTNAERMTTPFADAAMLRFCRQQKNYRLVEDAWQGQVCCVKHCLALGFKKGSKVEWHVCLYHWPKSAACYGRCRWRLVQARNASASCLQRNLCRGRPWTSLTRLYVPHPSNGGAGCGSYIIVAMPLCTNLQVCGPSLKERWAPLCKWLAGTLGGS